MGNASVAMDQEIRHLTANHVGGLVHILVHAVYAKGLAPTQPHQNLAFHVMEVEFSETLSACAVSAQVSVRRQALFPAENVAGLAHSLPAVKNVLAVVISLSPAENVAAQDGIDFKTTIHLKNQPADQLPLKISNIKEKIYDKTI